ncbi:hypothetical protein C8R47DRAFT_1255909 [Mycena vitilis]|nr:hypothetical protein C8R47DRAFT_1255909 [Mycena vitilis]
MAYLVDDVWMIIVWMICAEHDPMSRAFTDTARRLALISRQLFSVVAAMPILWANIIVDRKSTPVYINRYLENSRTRLLNVTLLHTPVWSNARGGSKAENKALMAAFGKAASRAEKWRSLRVVATVPETMLALCAPLDGKLFPSLTHLSLVSPPCAVLCPVVQSVLGGMSSLTHLELVGIPAPWNHIHTFVGLQHLSVRQPRRAEELPQSLSEQVVLWPTTDQLTDLLQSADQLVVLELEGIGVFGTETEWIDLEWSTAILATKVTTLILTLLDPISSSSLAQFLDLWHFPQLTKLHVWFHNRFSAFHWEHSELFRHPRHIGLGGTMDSYISYREILTSVENAVTLDLREAPGLADYLTKLPYYVVGPKVKEVWLRGSISEARDSLRLAPLLETVIWEREIPPPPQSEMQATTRCAGRLVERDYSDTPRTGYRFQCWP